MAKASIERLQQLADRSYSESRLTLARNLSFGAAAACLVLLTQLIPLGTSELLLEVAVVSAGLALPLWVGLGIVFEIFVYLGPVTYPVLAKSWLKGVVGTLQVTAGMALIISIGAVLYRLSEWAVLVFGVGVCVAAMVLYGVYTYLADWLFGPNGVLRELKEKD